MISPNTELTVLMAVYNGSPFLRTAIDSILDQTYRDFCFLIVDDASTDDTREIVRSYEDERIELLCVERNVGQTAALNVGLHHASTPWIARMDADDYSAPTRFEEQMKALEADPSISCLGTFAWFFHNNPENVQGVVTTPLKHDDIRAVLVGSPIVHGSLIARREALIKVGSYNDRYRIIADIELYDRLLPNYNAANLDRQLLGVRRHLGQSSNGIAAFNETIELYSQKLAAGNYPKADASIVRAALSRAHIFRARRLVLQGRLTGFFRDMIRGFKISPKSFFWDLFVVFIANNFSQSLRARVKGLLGGALLPLKRGS